MRAAIILALLCAATPLCGCDESLPKTTFENTTTSPELRAADGVAIFSRFYPAAKPKALILLFHQAGSSKDEYATIAPRLAAAGYSSLAIDQRSGGDMFGPNETVKALGHEASYLDAKQDLDAALAWTLGKRLPVILWGSSYSASLVFLVAAEHPDQVRALLAFSPGEYLGGHHVVADAAAKVAAAVFVTSAQDPKEIQAARTILAAVPHAPKVQFTPIAGGVHGSSTLIAARNPGGSEAAWAALLPFLDGVTH